MAVGVKKKHAFPRVQPGRRQGAPAFWAYMEGQRRTFAADPGDVADLMGSTPAGTRGAGATWTNGPRGPCLAFSGAVGAYASFADAPILRPAAFSLGLGFVSTSAQSGYVFTMLAGRPGNNTWGGGGYGIGWVNSTLAVFANSYLNAATAAAPAAGTVVRAWGTYDGAALRLYLQGALVATKPYATPLSYSGSTPLWVGGDTTASGSHQFTGTIDDVRLLDYALAPAEVARDYADPDRRLRRRGRLHASAAAAAARSYLCLTGCGS